MQRVEHRAHGLQKLVVVRLLRARTGHDGCETGGLGHRNAADVEVVNQRTETSERSWSSPKLAASTSNVTRAPMCVNCALSKSKPIAVFGQPLGFFN